MDFTITRHRQLLETFLSGGYRFFKFSNYLKADNLKHAIILRHDVEKRYINALHLAKIQNKLGIKGTYFFRILPGCFQPEIVLQIADLGHEIGYHYDDLAVCKGDYVKAIKRFQKNLKTLRKIVPVETICMDGSPLSKYDNKALWNKYNYKDFGIIGEPYFDIDFNKVFYLTDTGRRWDGWKMSVRDKMPQQRKWTTEGMVFHSTKDIIKAVKENKFPNQVMITFHPQRWNDKPLPWMKELVLQNVKNQVKRALVKRNVRD